MNQKWKQFEYTKDPDKVLIEKLGLKYKEYRDKWASASRLEKIYNYPIHLDFELNYGCNLRCPQCILQMNRNEFNSAHPYYVNTKKSGINFDVFQRIIDEGVDHGLSSITVGVNNEPLMNPRVAQFIQYARSKGVIDVILLTNGTLLTEELARNLIDSGLTKLYFSIDAIRKETYEILREGGDLESVMNNINNFLRIKKEKNCLLPLTRVSFVKSKINAAEADEFIRYWETKVDFVSMQAFVTPAYGHSNFGKLKEMFQIENSDLKKLGPCPQPYQRLTIYHDGSVHPCCHWSGATLIVGNIYSDSIYSIWNSDRLKKIRIAINDSEISPQECIECKMSVFGKVN